MSTATLRAESKKTTTDPVAKCRVTWTDPLIDPSIEVELTSENRVSHKSQVADLITDVPRKWASTNDPDLRLDGTYYPMPDTFAEARQNQVGAWGGVNSDDTGDFHATQNVIVNFSQRPVFGFVVCGDNQLNEYPIDFNVYIQRKNLDGSFATLEEVVVRGNDQVLYSEVLAAAHNVVDRMVLGIYKWSKPNAVFKITEFYSSIVREYGPDDIISLSILEETESSDGTLPIGNISANEMDLELQNLDDDFFPGNTNADLHTLIKRNRKMEPSIGFRYADGTEEYVPKGLYWSGDWNVPELGSGASTSARDRMELFRKFTYKGFSSDPEEPAEKTFWRDIGLKNLLIEILTPLLDYMPDLFWDIDDALNDIVIPYAFFKQQSYFDCIKQIAQAGLAYAYMDTPTDAERAANVLCADVLRVKSFANLYGSLDDPIQITSDDYEDKNLPARSEEVVNVVNVTKKVFRLNDDNIPEEDTGNRYIYTIEDTDSVLEFGRLEYDYTENDLIQTETQTALIGESLVNSFKIPRKDVELETFGDPTLKIADVIEVPEYQKNGVDVRGIYAIKRLNTQYDGGLRISIEGRKGHGIG